MDKQTRLAFRILANLFPDKKPSEIKKIITDALKKKECPEDVELWMVLTRDLSEEKETPVAEKKVIEEHHYHHYDWYHPYYVNQPVTKDYWTITCNGSDTISCSNSGNYDYDSITISSNALTL